MQNGQQCASTLRDSRILILGGLGFIGSNLAIRLAELGARVTLSDAVLPRFGAGLHNIAGHEEVLRVNFADLRDAASLDQLVKKQDFVYCLAGQLSHSASMHEPHDDLSINCSGYLNVLEACRKNNPAAKLVFTSTRQIYGKPQYLPVDEKHPIVPIDINGIHKWAVENYLRLYSDNYGIDSVTLRLTNTYGPKMDLMSNEKGFIGIFVRRALLGQCISLYGGGGQVRDFNYIDDVVDALVQAACAKLWGRVFNLGHETHHSLKEVVMILKEYLKFEVNEVPFPKESGAIDIGDYYGSFAEFRKETGWTPKVALADGLHKTILFYQHHLSQYLPTTHG